MSPAQRREAFHAAYGAHLRRIGVVDPSKPTDGLREFQAAIIALYGAAEDPSRLSSGRPFQPGVGWGKDSLSLALFVIHATYDLEKRTGHGFPVRLQTMLQGGLPDENVRIAREVLHDVGAEPGGLVSAIAVAGRFVYDFADVDGVLAFARQRDADRIMAGAALSFGGKPRPYFCGACNQTMVQANGIGATGSSPTLDDDGTIRMDGRVIRPIPRENYPPAMGLGTGDDPKGEVGKYLRWIIDASRSAEMNARSPGLRESTRRMRSYPDLENGVLAYGQAWMNYLVGDTPNPPFDFAPVLKKGDDFTFVPVYSPEFPYDGAQHLDVLSRYFDFDPSLPGIGPTESDCLNSLAMVFLQAGGYERLQAMGLLPGVDLTREQWTERLFKEHYIPLMFEKKIPPMFIGVNLARLLSPEDLAVYENFVAEREGGAARLFSPEEGQRLTAFLQGATFDPARLAATSALVDRTLERTYGWDATRRDFMTYSPFAADPLSVTDPGFARLAPGMTSPALTREARLRAFLQALSGPERGGTVKPEEIETLMRDIPRLLGGGAEDPALAARLEGWSGLALERLRHMWTVPLSTPIVGSSEAEVREIMRLSPDPTDRLTHGDPYKRPVRLREGLWIYPDGR